MRIGQTGQVSWMIVVQDGSYMNSQEQRLNEKWAKQLLTTLPIPAHATGAAADIVAYEVARQYWGSPFNRYSWTVHRPTSVDEYQTDYQAGLGAFLSDVAAAVVDTGDVAVGTKIAALLNKVATADLYQVYTRLAERADTAAKVLAALGAFDADNDVTMGDDTQATLQLGNSVLGLADSATNLTGSVLTLANATTHRAPPPPPNYGPPLTGAVVAGTVGLIFGTIFSKQLCKWALAFFKRVGRSKWVKKAARAFFFKRPKTTD